MSRPLALRRAEPTAKFIAGGTNLLDLMKLQIETPTLLVDIGRLPLAEIEETAEGGLRIGALSYEQRGRRRYAGPPPLSVVVAGDPGGRIDAASQQGHHRRQSSAAHAVPLFLRHDEALQQAHPGLWLPSPRRSQPHERRHRSERGLYRRTRIRHGGCDDGARRAGRDHRSQTAQLGLSRSTHSIVRPAPRLISRRFWRRAN